MPLSSGQANLHAEPPLPEPPLPAVVEVPGAPPAVVCAAPPVPVLGPLVAMSLLRPPPPSESARERVLSTELTHPYTKPRASARLVAPAITAVTRGRGCVLT
jgi:hypothetical protein